MKDGNELVAPFRGERYAAAELSGVVAPPYDVIAPDQRAALAARDPHNIVHLMLPEAPGGGDRYAAAAEALAGWRRDGVVRRDAAPAVYVLAQDFALPSGERHVRVGMFAAVRAEPYETRRVRPHERTHAGPKADRLALLRATATNLESIFLLAPDADAALARELRAVTAAAPVATATLDGVGLKLWTVTGPAAAGLAARAGAAPLYIADGHHRYETSVAYARENPAAERVLAFVVSARDAGLTILATHRVLFARDRAPATLLESWRSSFDVRALGPADDPEQALAAAAGRVACVVLSRDAAWLLTLRHDVDLAALVPGFGAVARTLDVAAIETLVVHPLLAAGRMTPTLTYEADAGRAVGAVRRGGASAAVLLNPTRVAQVFAVADAGEVMPQKSTYFVPKVPSGVVLRPVAD